MGTSTSHNETMKVFLLTGFLAQAVHGDAAHLDVGCAWGKPSGPSTGRYGYSPGCTFPHNVSGVVGDFVQFPVSAYSGNVAFMTSKDKFDNCDATDAQELAPLPGRSSHMFKYTFNSPGTYYLSSSTAEHCAAEPGGQKLMVIITGTSWAANTHSLSCVLAPDNTANPGADDDWSAFGKGVYHTKAYDNKLHAECTSDTYCLDRESSRGSCYYAGEDFHIGHAIFCDVPEEECCGYLGCAATENRGKHTNGEKHNYYWYAPGYASTRGSGCCHCQASCAAGSEQPTRGQCTHYDVTSKDCQRDVDPQTLTMTAIGHLQCTHDNTTTPTIRETDASVAAPSKEDLETNCGMTAQGETPQGTPDEEPEPTPEPLAEDDAENKVDTASRASGGLVLAFISAVMVALAI